MKPPFRHRIAELCLIALPVALLATVATARSTDRDQALKVNAGGLDGPVSQNGDTVLTDVTITQGSLRIEASRATVTRTDGEVTRVVLEGQPASLRQENDAGLPMLARASRIDYDTGSETVLLRGAVQIEQGRDTFRGEQVRYDTRNGHISGDGGTGGRIELTIQPKPRSPAN